jgi:hypothetical protein
VLSVSVSPSSVPSGSLKLRLSSPQVFLQLSLHLGHRIRRCLCLRPWHLVSVKHLRWLHPAAPGYPSPFLNSEFECRNICRTILVCQTERKHDTIYCTVLICEAECKHVTILRSKLVGKPFQLANSPIMAPPDLSGVSWNTSNSFQSVDARLFRF